MRPLWAYRRDGTIQAVDATLRLLLIGYDMMSLIGLVAMRKRLEAKGDFCRVLIEPCATGGGWTLFRGDRLVRDFVVWQSGIAARRAPVARSACGWLSDRLSGEDAEQARRLWYGHPIGTHPPERVPLRFLAQRGYSIRRARVVVLEGESSP